MTKNPVCRRACSGRMPFYGRDTRVPRRGIAPLRMTPFPVILGQIRNRRRGRKKGACLRRREGAEGSPLGRRAATFSTSGQNEGRRIPSVSHPSYGRDPRVPRRGIAGAQDDRYGGSMGGAQDDSVPLAMTAQASAYDDSAGVPAAPVFSLQSTNYDKQE